MPNVFDEIESGKPTKKNVFDELEESGVGYPVIPGVSKLPTASALLGYPTLPGIDSAPQLGFAPVVGPEDESISTLAKDVSRRFVADPAISALKGAIGIPEAAVGLADIVTGGGAGKALEAGGYGFRPKVAKEFLEDLYSPEQKLENEALRSAKGFIPTIVESVKQPSTIAHSIIESLPAMVGGAGVARKVISKFPKISALVGGAIGEGAVGAGQAAEQSRQQSESGLLTPEQAALALSSGAITGLVGVFGGKVAKKLGVDDIDTLVAGATSDAQKQSLAKQIAKSFVSEGVLEELPQSALEQIQSNIASGKPWNEGVSEAAAQGLVTGGVMGAGANVISGQRTDTTEADQNKATLDAAAEEFNKSKEAEAGNEASFSLSERLLQAINDYAKRTGRKIYHGSYTEEGEKYLKHINERLEQQISSGALRAGDEFSGESRRSNDNQTTEGPGATPATISPEVSRFITDFQDPNKRVTNASDDPTVTTTQNSGLGVKTLDDLKALAALDKSNKDELRAIKEKSKSGEGLTPEETSRYMQLGMKVQFPREVIETATNSGSWSEENQGRVGKPLPPRPLDWKKNPEIKKWLQDNGEALGIKIEETPVESFDDFKARITAEKSARLQFDTKQKTANFPYAQPSASTAPTAPATAGVAQQPGTEASLAVGAKGKGAKTSRPRTISGKARNLVPGEQRGSVTISHWSNADLTKKKIDPKFHGKGIKGAERTRKLEYPQDFPDRSYYGLSGYSPEQGLGPRRHDVTINADHLYDFKNDPDNLYEKAQDEAEKRFPRHFGERYDQATNTIYERLISEAGYVGYYNPDFKVAAIFKALPGSGEASLSVGGGKKTRTAIDVLSGWAAEKVRPPQRVDFELSPEDRLEGASGYSKVFAVADHLSRRNAEAHGALRELSDRNSTEIANAMADEVAYAVKKNSKAVGWYGSQMRQAMRSLIDRHPDLDGDKGRQAVIRAMIAITSNGQDVNSNFARADELYSKWKTTGKVEIDGNWGGVNKNAINDGLAMLDRLISVLGVDNLPKFLSGKFTVGELRSAGLKINGEKSSHEAHGSLVFGPKIGGGFYQNLSGNFDPVTMDRWFMRTFNRYRGTLTEASLGALPRQIAELTRSIKGIPEAAALRADASRILAQIKSGKFDPYTEADSPGPLLSFAKNKLAEYVTGGFRDRSDVNRASQRLAEEFFGLNEAPANASERDFIRASVNKAQAILSKRGINLTNADLQAVLWYLEKEIYGKLGATSKRAEPASYADAAKSLGRKQLGLFEEPERAADIRGGKQPTAKIDSLGKAGKALSPKASLEAVRRGVEEGSLSQQEEDQMRQRWEIPEPVSRESVREEMRQLQEEFPAGLPVVVVNSYQELPDSLHQVAYRQGANPAGINGAVTGKTVYIVADNLSSLDEARQIWLHEQAGHFATDAILGKKISEFMGQVHDSFANTALMADTRSRYKNADSIRLGREFVARLSENPQADTNAWNRLVAMVRQFLRDIGWVKTVSENDIRVLLDSAMNKLANKDTIIAGNATIFSPSLKITAYHGTPHKIKDRFRTDKIGSGEGAQVYGWGLYFAEQELTAKHYRDVLSTPEYFVDGEKIKADPLDPINIAIEKVLLMGQDRAETYAARVAGIQGQSADFWMLVLDKMASLRGKKIEQKAGSLYTVSLDFDPEDTLDYEATSDDLTEKTYTALKGFADKKIVVSPDGNESDLYFIAETIRDFLQSRSQTVGDFYDKLGYQLDGNKAVSEFLSSLGIKGIRFADQGSRDKEQKTYNYVVFDDGDITITHENGDEFTPTEVIENPQRSGDESISLSVGGAQPDLPGLTEEQKTQERKATQGRFFTGDYTATDRQQQKAGAEKFIEYTPNSEVIDSIAQFASGKSVPGLSQQNVSATIAAVMKRMFTKIGTSKNPAEVAELWRLMDRAKSLAQQEGSVVAQTLEARKVFGEELGFMSPILAFRGLAQKAWAKAFGLPEGKSPEEAVAGTTKTATQEAGEEVQDEIEESEAEGLAQSIVNSLAKSQSDTLSWPKKSDASVKEVVKWFILGDITDAEFYSTMEMLGISQHTSDVLLSVSQREQDIRKAWESSKPRGSQDRKKNQAEMRKLRAQAMIALRLGATAENQVDAVINEFSKSQSDTPPAERAKQANGVKEAVKGMLSGDIQESEFNATLENIGIAATKRSILTSIVKREIEIRKQWKLQKEKGKAGSLTSALLNSDSKIRAILNKVAKEGGINWSELFLDESRATQKQRMDHLLAEIRKHPLLQGLTKEQSVILENALSNAWESARLQVFKREFSKRIKLPTVEAAENLFKKALPELIRQANLGTLDDSSFLNAFAKELGLPSLSGEAATKLTKLAQEAQEKPDGVLRNKILQQMIDVIQQTTPAHPLDIIRDYWYNNALSGTRTLAAILTGSWIHGAVMAAQQAMDAAILKRRPKVAGRILQAFLSDSLEGVANGWDVFVSGDYTRRAEFSGNINRMLSGQGRLDSLEGWLKHGNLWQKALGITSFVRRAVVGLDYVGAIGTRGSGVIYNALLDSPEQLQAAMSRFDKEKSAQAKQQAKAELGAGAKWVDVRARQLEILETGIDQQLKDNATVLGEVAALNSIPVGWGGIVYRLLEAMPRTIQSATGSSKPAAAFAAFTAKTAAGLAFARAAINMTQSASNWMPVVGGVNYARAILGKKIPEGHWSRIFGVLDNEGNPIPDDRRRLIAAAQISGLALAGIAYAMTRGGGDDEDKDQFDVSGSWYGLTPQQRKDRMAIGERPLSIRVGGRWINYGNLPFGGALAMIGNMRDKERKDGKRMSPDEVTSRMVDAWASGLFYIKDISVLSGLSRTLGVSAMNTDESASALNRLVAQQAGNVAGLIPFNSAVREIDTFFDPNVYKPTKGIDYWIRGIPFVRRSVGEGVEYNMAGLPVENMLTLQSRLVAASAKRDPVVAALSSLISKGAFPHHPDVAPTWIKNGQQLSAKDLPKESYEYQIQVLKQWREVMLADADYIKSATPEEYEKYFEDYLAPIRDEVKAEIQDKIDPEALNAKGKVKKEYRK